MTVTRARGSSEEAQGRESDEAVRQPLTFSHSLAGGLHDGVRVPVLLTRSGAFELNVQVCTHDCRNKLFQSLFIPPHFCQPLLVLFFRHVTNKDP